MSTELEYEILLDKCLLFRNADPDAAGAIQYMEDKNEWYENPSEYNEHDPNGIPRDDCYIDFPSEESASVLSKAFQIWMDLYGKQSRDPDKMPLKKEDVEYNGVRYRIGGHAGDHVDQPTEDDIGLVNACIYLNDDYEGGELGFPKNPDVPEYKPQPGDITIFPGHLWHYANPVTSGVKYLSLIKIHVDDKGTVRDPNMPWETYVCNPDEQ